jgi:hypothetical protein
MEPFLRVPFVAPVQFDAILDQPCPSHLSMNFLPRGSEDMDLGWPTKAKLFAVRAIFSPLQMI